MKFAGTPVFALVVLLCFIVHTEGAPVPACIPGDVIDVKLVTPLADIYWVDESSGMRVVKLLDGIWDFVLRKDTMIGYGRPLQEMKAMRDKDGIPFIVRRHERVPILENEIAQHGIRGVMPLRPLEPDGSESTRYEVKHYEK